MLKAYHLSAADYPVKPWKNGQGETREIAVDEAEPFRWRLSTATLLQPGSFSNYPDYDRILVLLRGGPVRLMHDQAKEKLLRPLVAYPFKGEWKTSAVPVLAADDFNLFCLRGKARAGIYPTFISESEEIQLPIAGQEHFIHLVDGAIELTERNLERKYFLGPGDTFRLSRETDQEYVNLKVVGQSERSTFLWMVVHTSGAAKKSRK